MNELIVSSSLPQQTQVATRGDLHNLSPQQMIAVASEIATALADIVERQKLYVKIQNGKHVTVEGWTTLGAMLGIVPKENRVEFKDGEFTAYVDLISLRTGSVVGGGSSTCGHSDPTWAKRPLNAQRSMAITRAAGKAYRLGYSWIMKLAGYEAAPAEEMDHVVNIQHHQRAPADALFNAKDKADIDWLKAQPDTQLMDQVEVKKVALQMHGRERSYFQTALAKLEEAAVDHGQAAQDAVLTQ